MHTKSVSAIGLALCLAFSPIAFGAAKASKSPQTRPAAEKSVKAPEKASSTWKATDKSASTWKAGSSPVVRTVPYQAPINRPGARAAATRPADDYTFASGPKYDYFSDHYGFTTGSGEKSDVMGYVAPAATKNNQSNPYIYRRK